MAPFFAFPYIANAVPPPVPPAFQGMYTELDNYLLNFNAEPVSGSGPAYPTLMTGSLKAANSNVGPQLLNGMAGVQLQLNALKAMGAQAIMVQVGFPVLYEPFLTSQGQSYTAFISYYQGLAAAVRQAGLKLVIENDTLLTNNAAAGWDAAPFYATLDWTQYQQARAQTALTIAQTMQPENMVVLEEPDTEAANSGQASVNTPAGATGMLSQELTALQQAGVPNLKVGAGVGSWLNGFLEFIQGFVTLPVDFIDFHIYPVNDNFLSNAVQIAATAAAAGKPVAMTECWLSKELDTEVGVLPNGVITGRDPFSFWAPLDEYFIQTMQSLAKSTQMLFMDPFGAEYYYAYQTYGAATENLTPAQILAQENALVSIANQDAMYTNTGISYYNSIVVPPDKVPPTTPGEMAGGSGNPTSAFLNWNAATDNVGVAGYYILRNGQIVGTTASLSYQDLGLTEDTTYAFAVQAFDLAGNLSTASAPVDVLTTDSTPPSPPGNVVATAVACTRASLTWTASTDKVSVTEYLVFFGLSPNALTQVAVTGGAATSYSNNELSPATKYYFALEAEDQDKNISYMSSIAAVTTPSLPAAPAGLLANATSASQISVSWSPSTGGLPIAYYLVYRGASAASLIQVATVAKTSYTDASAAEATTYYYAVQAQDTGTPPAQSGLSAPVSATTFRPPSAPVNLVATPDSCTAVSLTWTAAASGGLPIANYRVYKGATPLDLVQIAITAMTAYRDTTDLARTTYYYAVQAADTATPPDLSIIPAPAAVATYGYPSVPANLVATPLSSAKIGLTWSASTSGGLPIAYYHVYGGVTPSGLSQIAVVTGTAYTNASLTAGTTYYYAVLATDSAADSSALSGVVAAATPQLPTTPATVTMEPISNVPILVVRDREPIFRHREYVVRPQNAMLSIEALTSASRAARFSSSSARRSRSEASCDSWPASRCA
jgi:fibronectin type 3 domain-containing protein